MSRRIKGNAIIGCPKCGRMPFYEFIAPDTWNVWCQYPYRNPMCSKLPGRHCIFAGSHTSRNDAIEIWNTLVSERVEA